MSGKHAMVERTPAAEAAIRRAHMRLYDLAWIIHGIRSELRGDAGATPRTTAR